MIKLRHILREAVEHKMALDYLGTLIKGTEWEGKVFLAGGAVRDELLGLDVKDLDLTVAAPNGGVAFAEWVTKKLDIFKKDSNPTIFPTFGTAKFNLRGVQYKGHDLSDVDIETVMTRKEQYTLGSRKPEVDYGTPEQDVMRRDLTINSLLKDLTSGEILDLTGKGVADIKSGIIRTPIDPNIIFKEDPLRMLRAIRFTVKYGWKLPYHMIKALHANAYMLDTISKERIQDELNKILVSKNPDKGIRLLQITGLIKYVAPELNDLVGMKQNKYHAWDAYKHTLYVLKQTPPKLVTRLAALFHDIGKTTTRKVINNEVHFFEHEDVGADMARDILTRLKYPKEIIDSVYAVVKNHMRTKSYGKEAEKVSDKALRKLQNDLGPHLEDTLDLVQADNISHGPESEKWTHNLPDQVSKIRDRLSKLGDFTGKLNIPIDGKDVLRITGEKPGKIIGDLLDVLKDKFLENPDISKEEAESLIAQEYEKMKRGSMQ